MTKPGYRQNGRAGRWWQVHPRPSLDNDKARLSPEMGGLDVDGKSIRGQARGITLVPEIATANR